MTTYLVMKTELGAAVPTSPESRLQSREQQLRLFVSDGVSIHTRSAWGHTVLMYAAFQGWRHLAQYALEQGVDPKAVDRSGADALTFAAITGDVEMAKLLLRYGAPAERASRSDSGPLDCAAYYGHTDMVQLLLRHRIRLGLDSALKSARENLQKERKRLSKLPSGSTDASDAQEKAARFAKIVRFLTQRRAELVRQRKEEGLS